MIQPSQILKRHLDAGTRENEPCHLQDNKKWVRWTHFLLSGGDVSEQIINKR